MSVFVATAFAIPLLLTELGDCLGFDWHGVFGGLGALYFLLAQVAATAACRRAGVLQESRHSETIERGPGAALAPFLSEAPAFEIKRTLEMHVRIDREGISFGKRKRLLWADVESCAVTQNRNAVGKLATTLRFKARWQVQANDKILIVAREEDAERIVPAIRFYLRGDESGPQVLGGDL